MEHGHGSLVIVVHGVGSFEDVHHGPSDIGSFASGVSARILTVSVREVGIIVVSSRTGRDVRHGAEVRGEGMETSLSCRGMMMRDSGR